MPFLLYTTPEEAIEIQLNFQPIIQNDGQHEGKDIVSKICSEKEILKTLSSLSIHPCFHNNSF